MGLLLRRGRGKREGKRRGNEMEGEGRREGRWWERKEGEGREETRMGAFMHPLGFSKVGAYGYRLPTCNSQGHRQSINQSVIIFNVD